MAGPDSGPATFMVPDVSDAALAQLSVRDPADRFSVTPGLVILPADYTTFSQDAASRQQVGTQEDEFEARSLRVLVRGHFMLGRRWNYLASYEYNGFDRSDGDGKWNATDLKLGTVLGPRLGTLSFGKIKEPFVYEMVGDAANLPQHERLLNPFFRSRNWGVQLANGFAGERGTWAVGWYNDWLAEGDRWDDSGNTFAGRVTFLPVWAGDGRRFLHVGLAARVNGADRDTLRLRGKPASNVADDYVDTGNLAAGDAVNIGIEVLWSDGPWSLLGEHVRSRVDTRDSPDPVFGGTYLTGSWIINGGVRPYDRKAGYARRVVPGNRYGALEAVVRLGRVDLADRGIDGGTMDGWWTALNWWATRRWKASIGYGNVDLDRFGVVGTTTTVLTRLQWIY